MDEADQKVPTSSYKTDKSWVKQVKKYQLPVIKQISHGDVMYNMVTMVNNAMLKFRPRWRHR